MTWLRSDKIAFSALGVSVIALLLSIVISIISLRFQYSDNVLVEAIPSKEPMVHVYAVSRGAKSPPQVTQLSFWCKIRLTNRSNKPISIVEASYREDDRLKIKLDQPFFSEIRYLTNTVNLDKPFELPIRLDSGDTKEFYALFPMSVSDKLGISLIKLMRNDDSKIDTTLEMVLFDPNYFSRVESEMLKRMRSSKTAEFIEYVDVNISKTRVGRNLLRRDDSGKVTFYDSNNSAPDGFHFLDSLSLHNKIVDEMIDSPDMTIKDVCLNFKKYTIIFQTGNGNEFKNTIMPKDVTFFEFTQ